MAMKVSKAQRSAISEAADALRGCKDTLTAQIEDYNAKRTELQAAIDDVKDALRSEFDDKNEGWQNGERGQAADAWISEIEDKASQLDDELEVEMLDIDDITSFGDQPE